MHLVPLFLLLLTPFLATAARESPLFDVYSTKISSKQEHERLDNYAIQLKNAPDSRALILVYAENENSAPATKARARRAVRYLVKTRGLNPARVVWRFEGACRRAEIHLYLLYPDQRDPARDTTCIR
jgi:hypothetical protein